VRSACSQALDQDRPARPQNGRFEVAHGALLPSLHENFGLQTRGLSHRGPAVDSIRRAARGPASLAICALVGAFRVIADSVSRTQPWYPPPESPGSISRRRVPCRRVDATMIATEAFGSGANQICATIRSRAALLHRVRRSRWMSCELSRRGFAFHCPDVSGRKNAKGRAPVDATRARQVMAA